MALPLACAILAPSSPRSPAEISPSPRRLRLDDFPIDGLIFHINVDAVVGATDERRHRRFDSLSTPPRYVVT